MITLAIDTSAHLCAVALHDDASDSILAERTEDIGRGHAERLMDVIGEVLAAASLDYSAMGRVAASVGPGSFTGLRVGLATARGIALGLGVPAVGVGALDALAVAARPHDAGQPLLSILDARRGEAYARFFGAAARPEAPFVAAYDTIAGMIRDEPDITLCGSGAAQLIELVGRNLRIAHERAAAPIAAYARLGANVRETGIRPEPLYLRPPDAKPQSGFALARA
ncbi:MAG: tRNA (adenosine(37)-N6)-threonylcarbamoyltransferase complex dimerization subunit type 1 TsaB [Nitratireductor sp.]|nr:tRNA (adenosine(37)-N6)-threonylcarbamoyltransferase complex dimerization subunit type 1 TsaB [Nitratireductor sp.]